MSFQNNKYCNQRINKDRNKYTWERIILQSMRLYCRLEIFCRMWHKNVFVCAHACVVPVGGNVLFCT